MRLKAPGDRVGLFKKCNESPKFSVNLTHTLYHKVYTSFWNLIYRNINIFKSSVFEFEEEQPF